jgi:signal transduction histidine kinase
VDDDELDRLAVRRCLQRTAIDVRADEATSASEALELAGSGAYDCILLDYYLPGEDSLAALRHLHDSAPRTPVVIFTGRGDEDIAVELMKSGAADYLPKASLTPDRLEAAVRHALQVWKTAEARRRAETLLQLLSDAARHLLTATDPDELVRGLWERIREPLGVDAYFNLVALNGAGERPRLASFAGLPENAVASLLDLERGSATAEIPVLSREPVHLTCIHESDDALVRTLRAAGIRACFCHPLLADEERLGTLCFASCSKDEFTADELDFLRTVSHYATSAYERLRRIAEMRESERRKDEFLATLAHELRDPLAPLGNVLELMKRSTDDSSVLRQVRDTMQRQLGQLVQLVDDLLDVSRITRSQLKLRKRRVELELAVQQAVETVGPQAEAARQELEVELPEQPVWLDADPVRLAQVLGNLLTNASKFTEQGGRILLRAEQQNGEVVVTVKDTGIGIPADKLTSIFEMFAQVSSARERSQSGLGIGLTLVSRLVEMHGGTVVAASDGPDKGSEFVVRLPVLVEEAQEGTPAPDEEQAPAGERQILIVDDNRDSASSLAMLLQMTGHVTREAYDGPEAIDAAREFRPDVVLLDIGLPTLDGFEVCRHIRAKSWGRDVLIVALSGWGQIEDRRKSKEAGFDHHMVKPVKHEALMKLLREHGIPPRKEAAG